MGLIGLRKVNKNCDEGLILALLSFFFFFDLKGGHLEFMCKSINRAEEINNNHRFFFCG